MFNAFFYFLDIDICFFPGLVMFISGLIINIHSDHILRNLRKPGETGYRIPTGTLFSYRSYL